MLRQFEAHKETGRKTTVFKSHFQKKKEPLSVIREVCLLLNFDILALHPGIIHTALSATNNSIKTLIMKFQSSSGLC